MKTQYWLTNLAIFIFIVAIGVVVAYKYVIPKSNPLVTIVDLHKLKLTDLSGTEIPFDTIIGEKGPTYCLIFDRADCYSCIYRGLEDLQKLKTAGQHVIAIILNDRLDEAAGWSTTQRYSPFYVLKKANFYHYIRTPATPVVIKLEKNKVASYYFIRP